MDDRCEGVKPLDEAGSGRVEQLVSDAVDAGLAHGRKVLPTALEDDFFEGDAAAGSAPGG